MSEILENQTLKMENVLSFRGKIQQQEMNQIVMDMGKFIESKGTKCTGNVTTATFSIDNDGGIIILDVEILMPLDKRIDVIEKYNFKENFRLVNALMINHIGNPALLQETCNILNQYILDNQLTAITVGYNVTVKVDANNIENTEIDVYVGISPNIL